MLLPKIGKALSLAKLRNLETIILVSIEPTSLKHPLDIWTMTEIRHLDIRWPLYIRNPLLVENHMTLYISDPLELEQPLFLNSLQTLHLHNSSFVSEIIRRTPNLKKLKILDTSGYPYWHDILYSLILLEDLETLHIELDVIHADLETFDVMIFSGDNFPPNLKKLTLSLTRSPWDVMNLLANLPNLEVLKAKTAFNGTDWKLDEDVVFHKLKYLQIKSGCLVRWEAGSNNFPMLEKLLLYGLNELEEIPESIGDIMTLKLIQIHRRGGKNGSGVEISAKKIQEEQESLGNYELQVQIT